MNKTRRHAAARAARALALALPSLLPGWAGAQQDTGADALPDWDARFQSTYVWQRKPALRSPYAGEHSLHAERERSHSFTATAALGWRAWRGGELWLNPEVAAGVPLSELTGLGGFTNGEMARSSGPNPRIYRARLFLRQTVDLGGEADSVEGGVNQLPLATTRRRLSFMVGNYAVTDLFDANAYSHDPRTQFLNWSLVTHGAWDFAADARGYTWGAAVEARDGVWALRAGRFAQPKEPNGQALDGRLSAHYGDQIELEHGHEWAGQPGALRLLAFRNRARMARYDDALALARAGGTVPDLAAARDGEQTKRGLGLALEQQLHPDVGLFARASASDGATETYAFTEIDRSLSAGVLVRGTSWGRGQDRLGLALAHNGLSAAHRDYLAAGGLGFFLGDGRLRYGTERVLEAFYNLQLAPRATLGLDWQRIANPGYNADRGPARFVGLRLHLEL